MSHDRFYRPIFWTKLELLNLTLIYRPIKSILSADISALNLAVELVLISPRKSSNNIGRVTYKSPPIFCRPIKSANFIVRLSSALDFTVASGWTTIVTHLSVKLWPVACFRHRSQRVTGNSWLFCVVLCSQVVRWNLMVDATVKVYLLKVQWMLLSERIIYLQCGLVLRVEGHC